MVYSTPQLTQTDCMNKEEYIDEDLLDANTSFEQRKQDSNEYK